MKHRWHLHPIRLIAILCLCVPPLTLPAQLRAQTITTATEPPASTTNIIAQFGSTQPVILVEKPAPDFNNPLQQKEQVEQQQAAQAAAQAAAAAAQAAQNAWRNQIIIEQSQSYVNDFDWGNCTAFVASIKNVPPDWGNARDWLWHAQALGWPTGDTPQVGAIGVTGAGYYGHVVVVTGVNGDGTITVTEMNVYGLGVVDTNTYPANYFSYIYYLN